jgi:hypothetical protein
MTLLYSIPSAVLLLAAMVVSISVACGGQIYVHRRFSSQDFVQHNEVGGFIIAVVGTLYAVVLGFLTVVVWEHFASARELVALESAAATDAWHTAVGLPSPVRTLVRRDMQSYANVMIDHEWAEMRHGGFDKDADILVMDAMAATGSLIPVNLGESNAQAATLHQLSVLHDDRLERIAGNGSGVSWFEWAVLFIGAISVICFCWLFGLRNERTHLLMTSTVAITIVSMLVLLFELQYPFRSDVGIGPDAWKATADHIRLMQTGNQMNMQT